MVYSPRNGNIIYYNYLPIGAFVIYHDKQVGRFYAAAGAPNEVAIMLYRKREKIILVTPLST